MSREKETKYVLKNFGVKPAFSSFLPGICGIHGTPIWCYYVNRGQGVACFGVEDKDHAIMEFYPAHQAYQNVKRTGFRTFIKKDGEYTEPFSEECNETHMEINMNDFAVEEKNKDTGLTTRVEYYALPEEKVGGLVRKLSIHNDSDKAVFLEVLDGMPALVPYGIEMDSLKSMGQTIKAWMQVEDADTHTPYFKSRASTADTAAVSAIEGGNFSLCCMDDGEKLLPIVDPETVFGYDLSLGSAVNFKEKGLTGIYETKQIVSNQFPCSFYGTARKVEAGKSLVLYQLIGQVAKKDILKKFLKKNLNATYFEQKKELSAALAVKLTEGMATKTGNPDFDAYCRYTYMDNILRGGYPMLLGKNKIFYVYSRKHGDLERDYNYFRMLPEFYTQGNGNFRDVNQNRRCDNFFSPFVGDENIRKFYTLIQLDGYNPLAIEKVTYFLNTDETEAIFDALGQQQKEDLMSFFEKPFTPGAFFAQLEEIGIEDVAKQEDYFKKVIECAESQVNADFGEGYWSDHWTYNLDLVENFVELYPDQEKDLLYRTEYPYYLSQVPILPRIKRYVKTENGIRQYHFLDEEKKRDGKELLVYAKNGKLVTSSLMEKLVLLNAVKYAALDAYGMGVEMEGGKPGWYDALNGMPGLFGSSMAETYELGRNLEYTIAALEKYPAQVMLLKEVAELVKALDGITDACMDSIEKEKELMDFWNRRNAVKETYWEKTYTGIEGEKEAVDSSILCSILKKWHKTVKIGIEKAAALGEGICPTYFTFEMSRYTETNDGVIPEHFEVVTVPHFLEGPVRYLKLNLKPEKKKELYDNVKNSDLYDPALAMYKVNESLENASFELGRAKAFTPGWLENESIWLHMEYKYLLELLKSGMYREFSEDFHKAAIPFQDPEVYGRSIYENSSFIASSKNPNPAYHGRGFVARLSGSTIEFIQMWKLMMFGKTPFYMENQELVLKLTPFIPSWLIGEDMEIHANFMGNVEVIYQLKEKKDYIPGEYKVEEITLRYPSQDLYQTSSSYLNASMADAVRNGKVLSITMVLS